MILWYFKNIGFNRKSYFSYKQSYTIWDILLISLHFFMGKLVKVAFTEKIQFEYADGQ